MSGSTIDTVALRRLLDLMGGDPGDLAEMLEEYRMAAPDLARTVVSAAAAGDVETLRIAAHTLKSNARDFGATRLAELCAGLEADCRAGAAPADAVERAAHIEAAEAEARAALSSIEPQAIAGGGT
ncbi:MAG: Hpt domain-containing protein [Paracoccaceae bacterium]